MARDTSSGNVLSAADASPLDLTGNFTAACWLNPDAITSTLALFNKGDGVTMMYTQTSTLSYGIASNFVNGATTLSNGVWYHGAIRWNGTNGHIFLNGTQDGSGAGANQADNGNAFSIGGNVGGAGAWDGRLAEVALWGTDLTADEIAALARGFSPSLIRPQSLNAYWPLYGNAGPEPDFKNGNNATLTGTPAKADHPRIIIPRPAIYTP